MIKLCSNCLCKLDSGIGRWTPVELYRNYSSFRGWCSYCQGLSIAPIPAIELGITESELNPRCNGEGLTQ